MYKKWHSGTIREMGIFEHFGRLYRLFGQSLFWVLFGLIGIVVGYVMLPLVKLFVRDRKEREVAARTIIGSCFRLFVWTACGMRLISCRVTGMEHYDPRESQLILANHPTLIDVVFLISLFPQVDCVIKEAVTKNLAMRTMVGTANYISNRDPTDLLESCTSRLRSGSSLLLFPEGTRTVGNQPLNFRPGAAEVAVQARATILPIVIDCQPRFLGKHEPWYYIPRRVPHFEIRVLAPVAAMDLLPAGVGQRGARRALNTTLEELFSAELT